MDKLTEMNTFIAVAKYASFSAAARQLQQSPSAVSKLITRLEARLGVRLLHRTTRQVSLTEAGEAYLQRCILIVDEVEGAEELLMNFGGEPKGQLTINASVGFAKYCLLPLLPDFQRRYPLLELNLQLTGVTVDLVSQGVDVAIRMGVLQDNSLVARKLCDSARIICASPGYLSKHGEPGKAEDLQQHNCLRMSTAAAFNQWTLEGPAGKQTVEVSGNFITDQIDVLHHHALQGGGIARLSEFVVAEDIAEGRLVPLLSSINHEMQLVHAVFPHRKHLPTKVRVFVDYLVEQLS